MKSAKSSKRSKKSLTLGETIETCFSGEFRKPGWCENPKPILSKAHICSGRIAKEWPDDSKMLSSSRTLKEGDIVMWVKEKEKKCILIPEQHDGKYAAGAGSVIIRPKPEFRKLLWAFINIHEKRIWETTIIAGTLWDRLDIKKLKEIPIDKDMTDSIVDTIWNLESLAQNAWNTIVTVNKIKQTLSK